MLSERKLYRLRRRTDHEDERMIWAASTSEAFNKVTGGELAYKIETITKFTEGNETIKPIVNAAMLSLWKN